MKNKNILAFDYGASSGRAIIAQFDGNKLKLNESYRFKNQPIAIFNNLSWDILSLFKHLKFGLIKSLSSYNIESLAIDTWGVDFGLLDKKGELIANPYHYRNARNAKSIRHIEKYINLFSLYEKTGIYPQTYNTLMQIISLKKEKNISIKNAKKLLFIPDLFNYFLTGEQFSERTIASTSQLASLSLNEWNNEILELFDIDASIFSSIVEPSYCLGHFNKFIQEELNLLNTPKVFTTASHDTASAVLAVPTKDNDYLYISSGTWSLLGCIINKGIITKEAFDAGYTNEKNADGKIRFLKNIVGMWIIQECRNEWNLNGENLSFSDIATLAKEAKPFKCLINPDNEIFFSPNNMPQKIIEYCKKTFQEIPNTIGEIARCIFESLAFAYKKGVENLENIIGKKYDKLYIVGGGSNNLLLNQFTANALNKKIIAGVSEATSLGNILCQMKGLGLINTYNDGKEIIKNSFELTEYEPQNASIWEENFIKYKNLV